MQILYCSLQRSVILKKFMCAPPICNCFLRAWQMITLKSDSVNAQYILGMQTVGLCYAQLLNNRYSLLVNILLGGTLVIPLPGDGAWLNLIKILCFSSVYKFEEILIKTNEACPRKLFPHHKYMQPICCHGNQFLSNLFQNLMQSIPYPNYATHTSRLACRFNRYLSLDMRFPTMWYVRPAKAQTSLRVRADWSEPLLVAWIFYEYWTTDRTSFGVSKLKRMLHRLVWVIVGNHMSRLICVWKCGRTTMDIRLRPN